MKDGHNKRFLVNNGPTVIDNHFDKKNDFIYKIVKIIDFELIL